MHGSGSEKNANQSVTEFSAMFFDLFAYSLYILEV